MRSLGAPAWTVAAWTGVVAPGHRVLMAVTGTLALCPRTTRSLLA